VLQSSPPTIFFLYGPGFFISYLDRKFNLLDNHEIKNAGPHLRKIVGGDDVMKCEDTMLKSRKKYKTFKFELSRKLIVLQILGVFQISCCISEINRNFPTL
jgi:hypothetical protein